MTTHTCVIRPDGEVRLIYADALKPLIETLGEARTVRASHVEPTADGRWQADLSPAGGPLLPPTELRSESLDLEIAWLKEHVL